MSGLKEGLQCSLFQCTANWAEINGTALKIGGPNVSGVKPFGKDIFVADCIFEITHNAPAGNIGLDLIAAEHVRLKGVRFDGFDTGILIRPGYAAEGETPSTFNVVRCYFEDVTVFAGKIGTVETGPAGNGLTIQPQNDTDVGQLCFVGCTFEPGINPDITSTSPGPGILIDANGGFIDTLRFASCYATRWTGPGMSIGVSGGTGTIQNVEVLGGMYSGNNNNPDMEGTYPYGIAIFGPASAVRLVGTSCAGHYKSIEHDSSSTSNQQAIGIYVEAASDVLISGCDVRENGDVGIKIVDGATDVIIESCNLGDNVNDGIIVDGSSSVLITGCDARNGGDAGIKIIDGASDVTIDSCDVTGNTNNGIVVDGTDSAVSNVFIRDCNASGVGAYNVNIDIGPVADVSNIQVTNCAGYNDQKVVLRNSTPPTSASTFHGYDLTNAYWGPFEFYIAVNGASVTAINVDGTVTHLTSGSFYIAPGENAEIVWAGVGLLNPTFLAIGK